MNCSQKFQPGSELWAYYGSRGNRHVVDYYYSCGLNVMPLRCDGSKAPKIQWAEFQLTAVPRERWEPYFVGPSGIGVICGSTSGGLEIIDFDRSHYFIPWSKEVLKELGGDLVRSLVIVQTPKGGYHLYYRCPEIAGNLKLAYDHFDEDEKTYPIAIETRGQGGQAVMPGSPPSAHQSGRPYRLARGSFSAIPTITPSQRAALLDISRGFDQKPPKEPSTYDVLRDAYGDNYGDGVGERPGDEFNKEAPWGEILQGAGWELISSAGGVAYWKRPNKLGTGPSASTAYCRDPAGIPLFHVFSSSATPFEAGESYTPFTTYTLLYHGGDYRQAAQALSAYGYGSNHTVIQAQEIVNSFYEGY